MQFVPSHLRIEKGSTVTWHVCTDQRSSMGTVSTRSHIISFDEIYVESPKLNEVNSSFTMSFKDLGMFNYGCCIYSRMRGSIEVIEA